MTKKLLTLVALMLLCAFIFFKLTSQKPQNTPSISTDKLQVIFTQIDVLDALEKHGNSFSNLLGEQKKTVQQR